MSSKVRQPSGKITLQLKIALRHTDPIVWRRALVPGAMPLNTLHSVLQAVMGWEDCHLHVFEIFGKRYSVIDLESDEDESDLDEYGVEVHTLLDENDHFTYEYDFGDSWIHDIEVEAVKSDDIPLRQAICVDGARACPPEDCGGTSRFADFVEIMADPSHKEHEDMVEWFGGLFDPAYFSFSEANARIQRIP